MKTPKVYSENLKQGIITPSMLEEVLYSYNKRAKNYRDRAWDYRDKGWGNQYWYDKYDNEGQCEKKKEMLYGRKSDLLNYCTEELKEIHKLTRRKRIRIEDDDLDYDMYRDEIEKYEKGEPSEVVYMNGYYDYELKEYITFINVYVDYSEYYLYYEFPNYSFHHPIKEYEIKEYKDLEVVDIDNLVTYGKDINNLLSLQFCDKVWKYIVSNNKN